MEYCKKCGAKVDTSTGCCINCGLHMKDYSKKKSNIGLKVILVIILLIAILLGVKVVMNMIEAKRDVAPDNGYLEVAEDIIDAMYIDGDMEKFISLMAEPVVESMVEQKFNGDRSAFEARMKEIYAELGGMKIDTETVTWNIYEEIDVVGVQLNQLEDALKAEVGVSVKIRAAKAIDMRVSYKQNGEEKEDTIYVIIGIVDGEWCLIEYS